jgi:hypothetical protein
MLIEHRTGSATGLHMRCRHCGFSNELSARDYAESTDATIRCTNCGENFEFGTNAFDLSSANEHLLDDATLPRYAWYHTSTRSEWPPLSKPMDEERIRELRQRPGWTEAMVAERRRRLENQALHLGSYEAAIESILRHMQAEDQHSIFYLYRVQLRTGLKWEPEWRNETFESAGEITTYELKDDDLDGIRYLNVHEAAGNLSLAVLRSSIASTQRIVLPVTELVGDPDPQALKQLRALRNQVIAIVANYKDEPSPAQLLSERAGIVFPVEPAATPRSIPAADSALRLMVQLASDIFLEGVSPVVRNKVVNAFDWPQANHSHEDDRAWFRKFAGLAVLLTEAPIVQQELAAQPWQTVTPGPA